MGIMISINNLQKRFGNFQAVDGVSFDIRKNEIFGLLGPNGAGKTTTISMICGLQSSSGGAITFNSKVSGRSSIGYCPQENIFYPKLTCFEQLFFIGRMYSLESKELKIRAHDLLSHLGLKDKTHAKAENLSGGMKRRLNICLALIHDPEILILDEPEAGLDPQSRILVRDFIKSVAKEKTVILTTHNMDEADRLADRIAIMDYGKLLLLDTPQNLKKTTGEGNILEIVLEEKNKVELYIKALESLPVKARANVNTVLLSHPNIVEYLVPAKNIADQNGWTITEIRLRENTLEDVFIHLTGRNLRQ